MIIILRDIAGNNRCGQRSPSNKKSVPSENDNRLTPENFQIVREQADEYVIQKADDERQCFREQAAEDEKAQGNN